MTVSYEWKLEILDPEDEGDDPDILEVHHDETWVGISQFAASLNEDLKVRFCLVRDVGNDLEGITDRSHAYVKDGILDERFEYNHGAQDGPLVPKRFHQELRRG